MSEIHGRGGALFVTDEDGEWTEVGTLAVSRFADAITEATEALASFPWQPTTKAFAQFRTSLYELVRKMRHYIYGVPTGHGGVRMRRRKHGGRWAKLDRRQKVAPAWLVKMRHD